MPYKVNLYLKGETVRTSFASKRKAQHYAKEMRKIHGPARVQYLTPEEVERQEKMQKLALVLQGSRRMERSP